MQALELNVEGFLRVEDVQELSTVILAKLGLLASGPPARSRLMYTFTQR